MSTERERLDEIGKNIKPEPDATGIATVAASASTAPAENPVPRCLGLGGALNTVTPCAACKLLRRRCAQECPFAPYFSPHEPHKFAAVHKVFGASNVSKMLLEVPEAERADAASSLVYEANLRLRDPVYGCMGAISVLQQQVNVLEAELDAVRAEIFKHRYRQAGASAGAGLTDDAAQATASFVAPAPSVHAGDVVSVAEAGQEVTNPAGAPGMSASSAVYVAEAVEQPSSITDHYGSLNTSGRLLLIEEFVAEPTDPLSQRCNRRGQVSPVTAYGTERVKRHRLADSFVEAALASEKKRSLRSSFSSFSNGKNTDIRIQHHPRISVI